MAGSSPIAAMSRNTAWQAYHGGCGFGYHADMLDGSEHFTHGGAGLRSPAARGLLPVFVAAACGFGLLWVGFPEAFSPVGQWDFEAYYYALKVHDAGGNAWDHAEAVKAAGGYVNHLMYPPHTLQFFRLFAFEEIRTAKMAFLTTKLVCLAALFILWTTCFVRAGARGCPSSRDPTRSGT